MQKQQETLQEFSCLLVYLTNLIGGLLSVSLGWAIGQLFFAALTLFAQISAQLIIGHYFKIQNRRIPKESLLLLVLYCGVPVLLGAIHGNGYLAVLSFSLGLAYVIGINPTSGIRSPSFRILALMQEHKRPIPEGEIVRELRTDSILNRKLNDLRNDGWLLGWGEQMRLSIGARLIVRTFQLYRRFLNIREMIG